MVGGDPSQCLVQNKSEEGVSSLTIVILIKHHSPPLRFPQYVTQRPNTGVV